MIQKLVDFALKNRFHVLTAALLLFVWGAISFHNLPVDAYPDVADNYVNIITQWPGHSAEDIEKQITVPTEIQMAGIPDMKNLRSFSLEFALRRLLCRSFSCRTSSVPSFCLTWMKERSGCAALSRPPRDRRRFWLSPIRLA
jgi:hypothetical protein